MEKKFIIAYQGGKFVRFEVCNESKLKERHEQLGSDYFFAMQRDDFMVAIFGAANQITRDQGVVNFPKSEKILSTLADELIHRSPCPATMPRKEFLVQIFKDAYALLSERG